MLGVPLSSLILESSIVFIFRILMASEMTLTKLSYTCRVWPNYRLAPSAGRIRVSTSPSPLCTKVYNDRFESSFARPEVHSPLANSLLMLMLSLALADINQVALLWHQLVGGLLEVLALLLRIARASADGQVYAIWANVVSALPS